jgi:HTH-type transcriptional regulator, cell division transcriptional repressor
MGRLASSGAYAKDSRSNPLQQDVLLRNTRSPFLLLHSRGMAVKSRKRPSRNIIGERVREARHRCDPPLTQDQLAGRLAREGVQLDRVALAKVEGGLRSAFDFEVKGLAAVLKVDANWLLGIDASTPPSGNRTTQPGKARA